MGLIPNISGGFGKPHPPGVLTGGGFYRTAILTGGSAESILSLYATNGRMTIDPTETAMGMVGRHFGSANVPVVPKIDYDRFEEIVGVYRKIKADMLLQNWTVGAKKAKQLGDLKVQNKVPTPTNGIRMYYEGDDLKYSFDIDFFQEFVNNMQKRIIRKSYNMRTDGLSIVGFGKISNSWVGGEKDDKSKFWRPGETTFTPYDGKIVTEWLEDPFTTTAMRIFTPYHVLLAAALADFYPALGLLTGDHMDYMALASAWLKMSRGVVSSIGDMKKTFSGNDIWENVYALQGTGVSLADPTLFTDPSSWLQYITLMIVFSFVSQRIGCLTMPVEFRRGRGDRQTFVEDTKRTLRPYIDGRLGSQSGPYWIPVSNDLGNGYWWPMVTDPEGKNNLINLPKLSDAVQFQKVQVLGGKWTSPVMEPTLQKETWVNPVYSWDAEITEIDYEERNTVEVTIPLRGILGDGEIADGMRKYYFMMNMLSDHTDAMIDGFKTSYKHWIRSPKNVRWYINEMGEKRLDLSKATGDTFQQSKTAQNDLASTGLVLTDENMERSEPTGGKQPNIVNRGTGELNGSGDSSSGGQGEGNNSNKPE